MHSNSCPDACYDPRMLNVPSKPKFSLSHQRTLFQCVPNLSCSVSLGDRLTQRPGISVLSQIKASHLPKIDTSGFRQSIHLSLQCKNSLITTEATKFPGNSVIRIYAEALNIDMSNSIRTHNMLGGKIEHFSTQRGISTRIRNNSDLMSYQPSVFRTSRLHRNLHRMPFETCPNRFGSGVMHANWFPRTQSKQSAVWLDI
ncbi:hypothetical protein D3C81_1486430 [compost metagenome]